MTHQNRYLNLTSAAKESVACFTVSILIFAISLYISDAYIGGDQIGYKHAFERLKGIGIDQVIFQFNKNVSSNEFFYIFLVYICTNLGFEKQIIMSLANASLTFVMMRWLYSLGINYWLIPIFVLTNYYLYVLYFSAERLKFGILFLVLALLVKKKHLYFFITLICSIFSHFSVVILFCCMFLHQLKNLKQLILDRKAVLLVCGAAALLSVILALNLEYLLWKFNQYFRDSEPFSLSKIIPILICFSASYIYSKDKIMTVLIFFPVVTGILILDGSRLNMFGYFLFLYFGFQANKGVNIGVITSLIYFGYRTVSYVRQITLTGSGF